VDDASAAYPLRIDPWVQAAKLTASDKAVGDQFGAYVAISGDVVVVGATYANPGGTSDAGAAYVFVKPGGGWTGNLNESAKLTASDKAAGDQFGHYTAISGDVVVVGSPYANPGGTSDAGAAYVFVKPGIGWTGTLTESTKLTASDKAAEDRFGQSVAISGDSIVVGAVYANPSGLDNAGAAYVFANQAPIADAGSDQIVDTNAFVTLNGTASSDPDGDTPLIYGWTQAGGPAVTFAPTISVTTFTAPATSTVLTFTLTVTDSFGLADPTPDEVVVTVEYYAVYLPFVAKEASTSRGLVGDGSTGRPAEASLPPRLTASQAATPPQPVAALIGWLVRLTRWVQRNNLDQMLFH
jgi:hypothetical protein